MKKCSFSAMGAELCKIIQHLSREMLKRCATFGNDKNTMRFN